MEYSFSIPQEALWIASIAVASPFVLWGVTKFVMYLYKREEAKKQEFDRLKEAAKREERIELEQTLPGLWIAAHDECDSLNGAAARVIWLKEWLRRQAVLPSISAEAAADFAELVAISSWTDSFEEVFTMLSTYIAMPGDSKTRDVEREYWGKDKE